MAALDQRIEEGIRNKRNKRNKRKLNSFRLFRLFRLFRIPSSHLFTRNRHQKLRGSPAEIVPNDGAPRLENRRRHHESRPNYNSPHSDRYSSPHSGCCCRCCSGSLRSSVTVVLRSPGLRCRVRADRRSMSPSVCPGFRIGPPLGLSSPLDHEIGRRVAAWVSRLTAPRGHGIGCSVAGWDRRLPCT